MLLVNQRNWQKKIYVPIISLFASDDDYMSVEVGKYGRIVLPKKIRKKYGMDEGIRLIITEYMGRICLVPVRKYEKPTEVFYGAVKLEKPIDEPKRLAREHIRKKLAEGL
jgi:AbrB family looped-hinge helix DNA binding protein